MAHIRRTRYALFCLEDDWLVDIVAALRADPTEGVSRTAVLALAVLTGQRHRLDSGEFTVLVSVPAERWVSAAGYNDRIVSDLVDKGLLLSDVDEERAKALRRRDEDLDANEWNLYAAAFHYMTQWSGVDIRVDDEDEGQLLDRAGVEIEAFVAQHGAPPPAFSTRAVTDQVALPCPRPEGEFYSTLMQRRTTRAFDPDVPMTLEQLGTVLHYVFGCHGHAPAFGTGTYIKRTSPSGGCLHPTEAYLLISNVTDIVAGIYHYDIRNHALNVISALEPDACRETATSFMCGQSYLGAAHVSFILSARFFRSHWKYRRHQKAYPGLLMDAAHLSQTLYLVAAELGLGAFFTIAINGRDIERRLELDGVREGVIAMAGCGPRARGESRWEPQFSAEPLGP